MTLERSVALTPYDAEMIAEDVMRFGSGARLEITLSPDATEDAIPAVQAAFAQSKGLGVPVVVHREAKPGAEARDLQTASQAGAEGPMSLATPIELGVRIVGLLHETRKEPGLTVVYVASGGRRFGDELQAQHNISDQPDCTDTQAEYLEVHIYA